MEPVAEVTAKPSSFGLSLDDVHGELKLQGKSIWTKMCADKDTEVDFSDSWKYSDIVFEVEDKQVHANKMILSMWSPVFAAMFKHEFKEKNAKSIELPGKCHGAVIQLMKVLHPPNEELTAENIEDILPLAQEYQVDKLTERCEEFLMSQASSIKAFLLAKKFNLKKLEDSNLAYLKRAPVSRLKSQAEWATLDQDLVVELLMDKCTKFEGSLDSLREVRMVLERKKPTTFPGAQLLCAGCIAHREQQVDCGGCMKSCCAKITEILRNLER